MLEDLVFVDPHEAFHRRIAATPPRAPPAPSSVAAHVGGRPDFEAAELALIAEARHRVAAAVAAAKNAAAAEAAAARQAELLGALLAALARREDGGASAPPAL